MVVVAHSRDNRKTSEDGVADGNLDASPGAVQSDHHSDCRVHPNQVPQARVVWLRPFAFVPEHQTSQVVHPVPSELGHNRIQTDSSLVLVVQADSLRPVPFLVAGWCCTTTRS